MTLDIHLFIQNALKTKRYRIFLVFSQKLLVKVTTNYRGTAIVTHWIKCNILKWYFHVKRTSITLVSFTT